MSHARRLAQRREPTGRSGAARPGWSRLVVAVLGVGLVVEAVHQIAAGNDAPDFAPIDDWLHAGLILASSAVCARGAVRRGPGPARGAWWCFAVALLLFAIAEITWGELYSRGGIVPTPNPTDVLYLATYPLFMAGLVLMVRARVIGVPWHRWLDGFVVVLIVATPGVALVIVPVLQASPIDPLGLVVDVAYPVGDVLLLGALLGSLPLLSWRLHGSWPWVAVGLICLTVADAVYSVAATDTVSHEGPYDFLWSAGALAIAVGSTRIPAGPQPAREITGWPAIILPLGAQVAAVAIQIYGYVRELPPTERLLTLGVLFVGIAQIIVSRPRPSSGEPSSGGTSSGEPSSAEQPSSPDPC
ncbi:hypothetical protein [Actinomycetospora sp. TBRC 11914]|uniref:hypothetical protein n=1 Tax=Actinomycetospora sp. TBRC 11914 TaxID=2729387 RepID=UPI00145F6191|nr:hypothetical protein [Actinomycetospora sp. TBRC 11914]NMO91268.1 hypothetical protein [Actinomycetospora sp. TBRC 11914]